MTPRFSCAHRAHLQFGSVFIPGCSSSALVLCLTRPSERWIRSMPGKYVSALFVVEHAAQPIAISGGCQPRRDACFTHDIHFGTFFDQQFQQRVPSPIRRTEERILIERGDSAGTQTQVQQKSDGLDCLFLSDSAFADWMI